LTFNPRLEPELSGVLSEEKHLVFDNFSVYQMQRTQHETLTVTFQKLKIYIFCVIWDYHRLIDLTIQ
jgi:hypothetical protein